MPEIIVTAVGPDRPGLVDELTGLLHRHGANLADARMVNLRGRFALILLAEAPAGEPSDLAQALRDAGGRMGLQVVVAPHPPAPTPGSAPTPGIATGSGRRAGGLPYRLRTYAMDQPGIVHRITHLLHQQQINIEELQTHLEAGSVTGTPLFTMDLCMTVPAGLPLKHLRRELETLCDELNCDLDLEPA